MEMNGSVDNRKERRRAISPVIATPILIVIAVVAAVAVYGFIQGFIAQTTSQTQAPSSIVIDAAVLSSADGSGTVVVRNVGQVSATVNAVYILKASDMSFVGVDTSSSVSVTVTAGSVTSISYNTSTSVTSGSWYILKVVTEDGSSATIKVRAT